MNPKKRLPVLGLMIVVGGLCLAWFRHRSEPRYQGWTARQWIWNTASRYNGLHSSDIDAAAEAIGQLGANAVPVIRQVLICERPFADRVAPLMFRLPPRFRPTSLLPVSTGQLRQVTMQILRGLPFEARRTLTHAIGPEILGRARLAGGGDTPFEYQVAIQLYGAAPEIVTMLRSLLRSRPAPDWAFHELARLQQAAAPALPELLTYLADGSSRQASLAVHAIEQMGPAAGQAVPMLEKKLARGNDVGTALALWTVARRTNEFLRVFTNTLATYPLYAIPMWERLPELGPPAVPYLRAGTSNANVSTRCDSMLGLWRAAPEFEAEMLASLIREFTNAVEGLSSRDGVGAASRALERMESAAAPVGVELERFLDSRNLNVAAASRRVLDRIDMTGTMRKPTLESWFGSAPQIDGVIAPGEWRDATEIHGVRNWTAEFLPVKNGRDLALTGWVKHDAEWLYFAFLVTDDMLYGIDTPRWLPKENAKAHELSREGFPWFGDEMEILLNAPNTWRGDESAEGDGASWQMVCNLTKSRLGGVGVGGLLEGEPRSSDAAWATYQRWIQDGSQRAVAKVRPGAKGYVIEWAVKFNPCVELAPGKFYSAELGAVTVGLNIAIGDLDRMEKGTGQFGNFHHEQWWAGARGTRTQKNNFGALRLMGTQPKR